MHDILKEEEIKDRVLAELDILQLLDILGMGYEDAVDIIYESLDEEQREILERALLSS